MKKRTLAIICVALILALLVSVYSQGFQHWNAYCWFGHDYGDDGLCTRCGEEKPADKPVEEQPKPEPDEPQATAFAAASLLADGTTPINKGTPASITQYESGFPDGSAKYPFTYNSNLNKILRINGNMLTQENVFVAADTNMLLGVSEDPADNFHNYYVYYKKQGTSRWMNWLVSTSSERNVTSKGIYQVFLMQDDTLSDKNYVLYSYSDFYTVYYGVGEELPAAPSKTGYTFTGWYTDAECTQQYTEEYVTSDITLYAGFRAHEYSIKFNANGGTGHMDDEGMVYDSEKNLYANDFIRINYDFKGWALSPDGDVVYVNNAEVNNLTAEDNGVVTLYAIWELAAVEVKFDVDGVVTSKMTVIGQSAELPTEPSKTGYIFLGWYTSDGALYNGEAITEACTLTAKFEKIRCTVTFIVDGEVYAHYVCDYGTSIKDALKASEVNTLLYKADSENF